MRSSSVFALVGSAGLAAASPFNWPFGGYGYGSTTTTPAYGYTPTTPVYHTPTTPVYHTPTTPVYHTPTTPVYHTPTTPVYHTPTTPVYTPPTYTPPSYTPPSYTPPSYTPPSSGGYGGGSGLNPIGWLGGIVGGLTGVISKIFDITIFFGASFDVEFTLADKTVITKKVSYLGGTALGELKVEHILVADVELHLAFLTCEFEFKEDVEIDATFDITSGWQHTYGKGNYGTYGSSAPAGVSAGATITWLTVIGIQCNITPPKGYGYPPGYTPPSYGQPYSYNPPSY